MQKSKLIFRILLIIYLGGCSNSNSVVKSHNQNKNSLFDLLLDNYVIGLNLQDLKEYNLGKEIRIWTESGSLIPYKLLVLKQIGNDWVGWEYEFWHTLDLQTEKSFIDSFKVKKILPKSGWNQLIGKLEDKGIFSSLSVSEKISKELLKKQSDGVIYCLETSLEGKYQISFYPCPDWYTNEYPQFKDAIDILNILDEELELVIYSPAYCH